MSESRIAAGSVRVVTEQYEFSHGKAPRGRGHWMFFFDGGVLSSYGTFTEAKKEARKIAAKRGICQIEVGA